MKRPTVVVAFAILSTFALFAHGGPAQGNVAQAEAPFAIASETYYRLDVSNGTASVKVNAQIQNKGPKDLAEITLWAMPAITDVNANQDGTALTLKVIGSQELGTPASRVVVTLPKPIKKNVKTTLTMTYVAPPQTSANVNFAAGAIEAVFMGQGPGSFILIDVPLAAETYLDPGCLKAKDQPKDLRNEDLVRWVCGEITIIALNAENQSVLDQCASLDDKCRQRYLISPYSSFAQSITDQSLRGNLKEAITLAGKEVTLELRYFRRDAAWAQKQFDIAKVALPKLEAFFGFPYPHDSIIMLQSHQIELLGAAGIAFPSIGQVLLTPGSSIDEHATVHELAHQWAGRNLKHKSIWEGLADYATQSIGPSLGISIYRRDWQAYSYKDEPLVGWDEQWGGDGNFWYGKAEAFFEAYEKAVGGRENMTKILSQVGSNPAEPRDHQWFMDRGEEVSGANLDSLYLTWVFYKDTATPLIVERRAAKTQTAELASRAATVGFTGIPSDIRANVAIWSFSGIAAQITQADGLITTYMAVLKQGEAAGLPPSPAVRDSWSNKTMRETAGLIEDTRQAILTITTAASQLSDDALGTRVLDDAKAKFAEGKLAEAKELAAKSRTLRFNAETAAALIAVAKAKQASFKPSLFTRIGLMGKHPDTELAKAEAAMAEGKPEDAIGYAKSAYKAWDGAQKGGLARLAIIFALMGGIATGTWWLLRKLDPKKPDETTLRRRAVGGHILAPAEDRKGSWKDWDNAP